LLSGGDRKQDIRLDDVDWQIAQRLGKLEKPQPQALPAQQSQGVLRTIKGYGLTLFSREGLFVLITGLRPVNQTIIGRK
jgi:hypothetical protein